VNISDIVDVSEPVRPPKTLLCCAAEVVQATPDERVGPRRRACYVCHDIRQRALLRVAHELRRSTTLLCQTAHCARWAHRR